MLTLHIPSVEQWDQIKEEFVVSREYTMQLEHSLVSLSKWESKWCKPFMSSDNHTVEETVDYIRCMTVTQNMPDEAYANLTNGLVTQVTDYIAAPMTATWFTDPPGKATNREVITSEIIYYWMIALSVPFECQKWHLNRLLTLIKVCNVKQQPKKKTNINSIMARNTALNEARKKQLHTEG